MTDSSVALHEARDELSADSLDRHRAIASLMEELEAVDWYAQRAEAAADPDLRAVIEHNRDEEKEHAAMIIEWLRRRDPGFDEQLRTYLFKEGPLLELEPGAESVADTAGQTGALDVGDLHVLRQPS